MSNNISRRWTYAEARAQYANADLNNAIQTAQRDSEAIGIAKEKLATAKRMKTDGMSAELIAKYTHLSIEEINGL